ncbi:RICIN domain-containing protein [Kribbella flavida]|uniref:RICIN domain-containing protein n=1 Tax=Kribbella flavida TaxID=182640 RepID=UPI00031C4D87|nr:RICIN domain-containing protein [Kribbella flavida]
MEQRPLQGPLQGPAADARRTGKPVEVEGSRTETSQVFVNPNGHHTLVQHAQAVRVRTAKGWAPVDHTLRFGAGGKVRPAMSGTGLELSGGGPGADLVALGTKNARVRLGWPGQLPRPVLQGPVATYGEVLPGVDLQLRAEPAGFTKVLVVKNRAAALNPALRQLEFPVRGEGLTIKATSGGRTVATDRKGRTVFSSGQALMWDAAKRTSAMPVKHSGGVLTVVPDQRLLTSPDTKFPLLIDPPWTSFVGDLWTHVNQEHPTTPYWDYDRGDGAKVGSAWGPDRDVYRSLFQLGTTGLAGARIIDAKFSITLWHTPSSTPTPVQLWHTRPISRAESVTWNSTGNHWLQHVATASGAARGTDFAMGFMTPELEAIVQGAADRREPSITLGLRAPDESLTVEGPGERQWKKFRAGTAALVVTYNTPPRMPIRVNFTSPRPCGTQAAPTVIGTVTPQFSAVVSDPDGDNVSNRLEIARWPENTSAHLQDSPLTGSGTAFSWSAVPAGQLVDGGTYFYTARSDDKVADDGVTFGPFSAPCFFRIDVKAPGRPTIASTDFPSGLPGRPAREVGILNLSPASGDTDVAEYRYGFLRSKLTLRVKARPDGTAALPMTVPSSSRTLFVRAVDHAGTAGDPSEWKLIARANPNKYKVRGDVNGDGAADVNLVLDHGAGLTRVWNLTSKDGSFTNATVAWDSDNSGGFALSRTRPVQGDFTGDGRADLAMFRDEPGHRVGLYLLISDGDRYDALSGPVWSRATPGWTVVSARVAAGDVTGDGLADIVLQLNTGNGNWQVMVYPGGNLGAPVQWVQTAPGSGEWVHSKIVVGDTDGDQVDDLVVLKKTAACTTVIDTYRSTRNGFEAPSAVFAGDYCLDKGNPAAGDVDADGKDDLVTIYDDSSSTRLRVFHSTGAGLALQDWWTGDGWDAVRSVLQVGDYDKDGKDDVALVSALTGGGREAFQLRSTGTAFSAPVSGWKEPKVGASTAPPFDLEARTYELVARHSGRCMEVEAGGQTGTPVFQQWDCYGGLHQRFRIVPVAGTEQYELHPAHANGGNGLKCLDVANASSADEAAIVQATCQGTGNQQVLLEYVEGSSYDAVFRIKFAHSGKCGGISGGVANGGNLVQRACAELADQQWVVRAALNSPQLDGRYKIRTMTTINDSQRDYVLDLTNCDGSNAVRVGNWSNAECQRWQLKPLGDDVYQIVDPASQKAIQVAGCSQLRGGQVVAFDLDASECQTWRVEPAADGSHTIQQTESGMVLDVPGCVDTTTTSMNVWEYWQGACQRWKLTSS